MIDDTLIDAAVRAYCEATYGTLSDHPFIAEGFRQGAQWAQEEYVKTLWHSIKEKPCHKDYITTMCTDIVNLNITYKFDYIVLPIDWEKYCSYRGVILWCYLSDILPQKGGEK